MTNNYDSFLTFVDHVSSFLLSNQTFTLSLIGILILYFGYFSNRYQPIRTDKLQLYISGFQFITTYFIVQIFIMYFILKYLTVFYLIYGASLILFVGLIYYFVSKVRFSRWSLILKIVITIILLYYVPTLLKNYISQIEDINWILFFLISYLSTMVIISNNVKGLINQNSYDYKEFYSKICEMNPLNYPIFSYPFRITHEINIQIFDSSRILEQIYSPEQLKIAGINIQKSIVETETWFNSLLILISFYVILTTELSLILGLILFIQLFFALTSIAIEHSIYTNGFLLVKVFPKNGQSFICRLMEINGKLIKVLTRGKGENLKFNPVEYYPMDEISKIRFISMREMLNEF